jgi:acetyl esterase/lipase
MTNVSESLATHGYNVFNISYRYAPEFHYPAQIEDLELAIDFIKKNYANQLDTENIGLWGYSAGAQIALMHALKKTANIKAVVAGGGPYDFTWWPGSPLITPYMGYGRDENIQGWLDASPISNLHKDAPAIFLYHGKEDELVGYGQMTAFDARAKLLGIDTETHIVEFWGHAFTFVFSKEALKKGILFLNKRMKP